MRLSLVALLLVACSTSHPQMDAGADLATNVDLAGADLTGVDLATVDLRAIDLAMPDLAMADLAIADLRNIDLASSDLDGVCGNGILEAGETCDDGANNGHETCTTYDGSCLLCSATCVVSSVIGLYCGDGVCTVGHETASTCPSDCAHVCGDGVIEAPEQCDNGATNGTVTSCPTYDGSCSACSATCTNQVFLGPYCGDGICSVAHGETGTTCNSDCSSTCGNGILEAGESCDDGVNNGHETCTTYDGSCLICSAGCVGSSVEGPYCGDGICTAAHETAASCPQDCTHVCGDGVIEAPEQCDQGAANGTVTSCATYDGTCTGCSATCTSRVFIGPYCGDGTCQAAHESSATCNADCHSVCGNGVLEEGETCDDGANNGHETCTTYNGVCLICSAVCHASAVGGPYCGDHICQAGIETSTTCGADCYCGNGTIDAGEVCDTLGPNVGTETCALVLSTPGETGTLGCNLGCLSYNVSQCM